MSRTFAALPWHRGRARAVPSAAVARRRRVGGLKKATHSQVQPRISRPVLFRFSGTSEHRHSCCENFHLNAYQGGGGEATRRLCEAASSSRARGCAWRSRGCRSSWTSEGRLRGRWSVPEEPAVGFLFGCPEKWETIRILQEIQVFFWKCPRSKEGNRGNPPPKTETREK